MTVIITALIGRVVLNRNGGCESVDLYYHTSTVYIVLPVGMANRIPSSCTSASALLSAHTAADTKSYDTRPLETVERHPEFFFEDKLVAIQVEGTLFNVHQYQLVKSEIFSDMFKIPKGEGPEEGSPNHPIVIRGVTASDFTALLRVLYASHFSSNPPAPAATLIIPAFRLANMWNFSELREYLLPLAEKHLDDADKIVFAREFDLKEWLTPAYEARKLEVDGVLLVSHMRERYRSGNARNQLWPFNVESYYCSSCSGLSYPGPGSYSTCQGCNVGGTARLRCYMEGTMAQKAPVASTTNTTLESEVGKWVENSYVRKN
ncbi:hypothetical protein B0J17DRAFT_660669 [Rhizoctonia solani]|nr:hypothetical protein B0J17DRAFT_660669 [Rhizoctonia solani]